MENLPNNNYDNFSAGEDALSTYDEANANLAESVLPEELRMQAAEILRSNDPAFLESEDAQHIIGAVEEYDSIFAKELTDHVENILNDDTASPELSMDMDNSADLENGATPLEAIDASDTPVEQPDTSSDSTSAAV